MWSNKMKKVILLSTAMVLSACGTLDNKVNSEVDVKEKAASALETTSDKVTISNRRNELGSVKFNATTSGIIFQCYYTTVVGISSDAICVPTDGQSSEIKSAIKSESCNALLESAGKCE